MKKYILVILGILFIFNPRVFADSKYETFTIGDEIRGAYGRIILNGQKNDVKIKFAYDSEGNVVYLESFLTNEFSNGESFSINKAENIDNEVWEEITKLMYYGYGYEDHIAQKWYVITQMEIWKLIYGEDNIYYVDGIEGEEVEKYPEDIYELKSLISRHALTPNFETTKFNYNQKTTLIDTNEVLKNFKTSDNIKIDDNELNFEGIKENFQLNFVNDGNLYDKDASIYHDNGTNIFVPGKYQPISWTTNFQVRKGIAIFNVEEDFIKCLECSKGVTYRIYNDQDELISEINTPKEYLVELAPGNYYAKDISRDLGYIKDEEVHKFTIENNVETPIKLESKKITNTFKFTKMNGKDLDTESKYEVYDTEGNLLLGFVMNQEGYFECKLGYGDYIVKHIYNNENYEIMDDFTIKVRTNDLVQTKNVVSKNTSEVVLPDTYSNSYMYVIFATAALYQLKKIIKK